MSATLSALLEQKRQHLRRLQEEIVTLERAQMLLAGRPFASSSAPAAVHPPDRPSLRALVFETLRRSQTPLPPRAIRAALLANGRHVTPHRLTTMLSALVQRGLLRRPRPGLYSLVASAPPTAPATPSAPSVAASRKPSRRRR